MSRHPASARSSKIPIGAAGLCRRSPTSACAVGLLALANIAPLVAVTGVILPNLYTSASAQADPDEKRRQLEQQRNELQSAKDREQTLTKDVAEIDEDRERLKQRLVETAALIQKSESKMSAIEGRLGELQAQEKMVRGSLNQRHGQIAKLLGALQRMGRNPPPVMITRRSDALQMVRSAMLLAAAFPELRGQAMNLSSRLNELVRVMDDIRSESDRLKSETARLTEAQTKLAGLMEERKKSLDQRRDELTEVRKASAEISRSMRDLTQLISRLDEQVKQKTNLKKYEEKLAQAAPEPAPPPAAGPIILTPDQSPGAETTRKEIALNVPKPGEIVELRPTGSSHAAASPGRIEPAIPFHKARGRLPLPAAGRTVLNFGEKTQYGGNSKGIVIETRSGAQITSPCDGWVVYAGEFRAYGQLLIINAGGGYHVLLAGLSRIDVEPGQFVLAAEPVGTMSGAASTRELKNASDAPVLYVEFRKESNPIDPGPWWVSGPEKVQG